MCQYCSVSDRSKAEDDPEEAVAASHETSNAKKRSTNKAAEAAEGDNSVAPKTMKKPKAAPKPRAKKAARPASQEPDHSETDDIHFCDEPVSTAGPEQLAEQATKADDAPGAEQPPTRKPRKPQQLQQSNAKSPTAGPEQLDKHATKADDAPGAEQPPTRKPRKHQQPQQSNAKSPTAGPEQLDEGDRQTQKDQGPGLEQCKDTKEDPPAPKKKARKQQPSIPDHALPDDAAAPASPPKKKRRARKGI